MTLRIFRILHYLETSRMGLQVGEIHQKLKDDGFEVDKRTVHRDLDLLEQAHIPLEKDGQPPDSKWKISPYAEIKQHIQFSYHEIFALFVARNSLTHLRGTPLHSAMESFFTKIEKVLGKDCDAFVELMNNIEFKPAVTWHSSVPPVILDTVYSALEEGHPIKLKYKAEGGAQAGKTSDRYIGPECLYFANGGVYLIGMDLTKKEPRTYALARMQDVEMDTDAAYEKQGLSPEKMFESSFGMFNVGEVHNVEILVNGPVAAFFAERRWHPSQESIKKSDGLLFKFKVKINDEFVRFILSMGPSATVVAPKQLKELVAKSAADIAKKNAA